MSEQIEKGKYDTLSIDKLVEVTALHAQAGHATPVSLFWTGDKDEADKLVIETEAAWNEEENELAKAAMKFSHEERLAARQRFEKKRAEEEEAARKAAEQKERERQSTVETEEIDGKELAWNIAQEALNRGSFMTLEETEEILVYDGGVYREGGEARIKSMLPKMVGDPTAITNHLVAEALGHVRRNTYVKRSTFYESGDWLVVEDAVLNVATGMTEPQSPKFRSLNKIPVRFAPDADCPAVRKFLSETLFPDDIPVVQEWVGYCLWRSGYPAQKAIMLIGEGSNGKSTLIGLLKALLGAENVSAVSLQELEYDRFAKADLFGKLANLYADLPDSALKSVGTFKMLTGGDPTGAQKKNQQRFMFINVAKLTFSCNVVPRVLEDTQAFFRRWIMVQFPHSFTGKGADRDLLAKLTTPSELSGFLNWALAGLKRLRENGWNFSNSKSTEDVRQDYIRKSDPVKAFLMDATITNPIGMVVKKSFYEAYVRYCMKNKLSTVTGDTFFKNLVAYFAESPLAASKETVDGKRENCLRGVELRPEEEWGKPIGEAQTSQETPQAAQTALESVQGVQGVQGFGNPQLPLLSMSTLSTVPFKVK